jgi:2-succinyl-6-hydroxy-2,4-cyclohexadiene-1-carboxylate synthase
VLHHVIDGEGPRVVLLHGFTQTLRSWDPIVARLEGFELMRIDAPGHGDSRELPASLSVAAGEVARTGGAARYIGYSMGGRICLRVAVDHPDLVRALVLIGTSPGIEGATERAARRASDEELANNVERHGVEKFLEGWLAQPLFRTLTHDRAMVEDRLRNTPLGLATALRYLGTGAHEPMWKDLPGLRMPVLLLAGEDDARYAALSRRMAKAIGANAAVELVPRAGHAAHLERPEVVARALERFLRDA